MSEWKEICSESDINELMDTCGGFHDACIVSLNYQSGRYVDGEGAMHFAAPGNNELTVLFHSQWDPKAFLLCFSGVRQMHIVGWQDNCYGDIYDAGLSFCNGLLPGKPEKLIVWADCDDFDPTAAQGPLHEPADTYVVAHALKWRIIEHL